MTIVVPLPREAITPASQPPTFSVIIPVYQGAWCVGDAVRSVLEQRTPAHEVLVCDDGSTDALADALAPFGASITLLRQDHRGVAAARNLGLFHASGEYVAICDADDLFHPGLIEAWTELAVERPDLDILGRASLVEHRGTIVGVSRIPGEPPFDIEDQRLSILRHDFIGGCAAFRRQRLVDLGGYDEELQCSEDYDSFIRLVLAGSRAGLNFEPLATVRVRDDSLSRQGTTSLEGQVETFTKVLARSDLSPAERDAARSRLLSFRFELDAMLARQAVSERRPDARARCLRVAMTAGQPAKRRAKAALSALAPRLAANRR